MMPLALVLLLAAPAAKPKVELKPNPPSTILGIGPRATAPVSDSGKYTVIVKRSGAGWHVAYAIYNSDQPPPKG